MSEEKTVIFRRPARALIAGVGAVISTLALAGGVLGALTTTDADPTQIATVILVALVVLAVGAGLINAGRTPLLTVGPDRLVVPRFFGRREIHLGPGHRVGELLASPPHGTSRGGGIEENRFVFFFAWSPTGEVVELASLHRASPMIADIRRALQEVAGLTSEAVVRDPKARQPWPDVARWRDGTGA